MRKNHINNMAKKKKKEKPKEKKIRLIWEKKKGGKPQKEEKQKEEKPKEKKGRPKKVMLSFILPGVYFAILSIGLSLVLSGLSMFENIDMEVIKYLYLLVGLMIMFFSIPFLTYYGSKKSNY